MDPIDDVAKLVRTLAFALRHAPAQFGVLLDGDGFADLDELVVGVRHRAYCWATLTNEDVRSAIEASDPGRFELLDGRVRARYGHSVRLGNPGEPRTPPAILFHGAATDRLPAILKDGLRPMARAFVHLTTAAGYAAQVVASKGGGQVLRVRAAGASDAGAEFFRANDHVWLVRSVPAGFLDTADGPRLADGGLPERSGFAVDSGLLGPDELSED